MRKLIIPLCAAFLLTGCIVVKDRQPQVVMKQGGPPPWAPAHGHRAKHAYQFYPSVGVYVNIHTGQYFYMSGGIWTVSAHLPPTIVLDTHSFVRLELETDRPYTYYDQHKVKYKTRGKHKLKKNKKRGKGHWKKAGFPF